VVRVNDRGPQSPSRLLDLSRKAAEELDLIRAGVIQIQMEVLSPEEAEDELVSPTPVVIPD
jgi:rare lipoprotein A